MQIYVGTYRQYNNGSLKGAWLDLTDYSDKSEFYEACKELHEGEEEPEFMFQDWEEIPKGLISESWVSEKVWEFVDIISDDNKEAFDAYVSNLSPNLDQSAQDIFDGFQEAYQGEYADFETFVEEFLEDIGFFQDIPETMKCYFDFEAYGRCELDDYNIYDNKYVFCTR